MEKPALAFLADRSAPTNEHQKWLWNDTDLPDNDPIFINMFLREQLEQERFLLTILVGLAEAIRKEAVMVEDACSLVLNLRTVEELQNRGVSPAIMTLYKEACSLCLKEKTELMLDIKDRALLLLKQIGNCRTERETWFWDGY